MLSIQTNVSSLIAQQNLNINNEFQAKTIQQLTSGYRINQSGDDAAGLAVANQYRNSVAELTQGVANGNDGVAQLQIMDGGMSNISQILDRLKTLATQSASGTLSGGDSTRQTLNSEFQTDLSEIDRQAQSIGLNTGGSFVQSLDVYLGQGSGSQSLQNGIVTLDLSKSAVDSQALGMKGMAAVNSTDIGATSATSVQNIVSNTSGTQANQEAVAGHAAFQFSGAGFSDAGAAQISVNLDGVTDVGTLVTAVNQAILSAGQGNTAAATAFKNANIVATVNTDSNGGQELSFSSSTAAFQVQAGDQMGNALLGNVTNVGTASAPIAQGTAVTATSATTVTGAVTTAGNFATTQSVNMVVSGGGLASPVTLNLDTSATPSTSTAIKDLENQFSSNTALQAAGLSMSGSSTVGGRLSFNSATGQSFSVQVTGDTANLLGLGSFLAGNTGNASYNTITAGAAYSAAAVTGNATTAGVAAGLEISLNGQASTALSPIDLTAGTSATAASVLGGAIGAGAVDVGATDDTLNISVVNNGVANNQIVTLSNTAVVQTPASLASSLSTMTEATAGTQITVAAGANSFMLSVNGAAATKVTVAAGTYTTAGTGTGTLVNAIQTVVGGNATVSWGANGTGALTITSNLQGATSGLTISAATDVTPGAIASGSLVEATAGTQVTVAAGSNSFMMSLNGGPASKVTITAGTYTTAGTGTGTLVNAIQTAVGGNATVSWGANGTGALTITSSLNGATSSVVLTTATDPVPAVATSTLTQGTTNNITSGTGTVLVSAADHNNEFTVAVDGGVSQTITVADGAYTTATGTGSLLAAINTQLASVFSSTPGVTATWAASGQLTLQATPNTTTGTASTLSIGYASQATAGVTTSTYTQTTMGTGGITAASGADSFKVTVDGGTAQTITLTDGTTYTQGTGAGSLVAAINGQLTGATASWDAATGGLTITSKTLGGNSSVVTAIHSTDTLWATLGLGSGTGSNAINNTGVATFGLTTAAGLGTIQGATPNDGGLAALGLNTGSSPVTTPGSNNTTNTGTTFFGLSGIAHGTNDNPSSLQSIANTIQTAFGATALVTVANDQISIASTSKGANSSVNIISGGANDASTLLKLSGAQGAATTAGQNMSISELVSSLNAQFSASSTYQTAGLTATATQADGTVSHTASNNTYVTISSGNGTQFRLNSLGGSATQTQGAVTSTLTSTSIPGTPITVTTGTNDQFKVAVDGGNAVTLTLGPGTYTTASGTGAGSFLQAVQTAISNSTLTGLVTAGWNSTTNDLTLTSAGTSTGTASSVTVSAVSGNTGLATMGFLATASGSGAQSAENVGFGNAGSSFTAAALTGASANTASTGTSMSTQVASGVSNSTAIDFTAMNYGSDKQALTFSAMDSNGTLETKTITLQNTTVGTGANTAGANIDSAVAYINQQLQASTNLPALQQIVAVKQANSGGTAEQINFVSKLSNFTVGVGASANPDGLNGGLAATKTSTTNGASVDMSISTQAGAEQAITAITNAVSALGSAQAAVGKGENQLNYAVNLAQSQITNFSAAESQIRDADVAAEAANLSKAQVLQQSTIAAMAQANSAPQAVLSLLKS